MKSLVLKDNIYWIGVKNPELKVFDIIMNTKKGTTYNSYLIADEKVAIIDTVKDGYFEEYIGNIKEIIGDRSVDYIIVQHTELDHSGSLSKLLEYYPQAIVVASKAANIYARNIVNREFKHMDAPKELSLGVNTLEFISAPNLHWPDTMFTYIKNKNILFTCDFLGCHYCPQKSIVDECSDDYMEEMKYYFDVIMGPFKKFVIAGIDKIRNLQLDIVAPSHGPIHVNDIKKYIQLYEDWAAYVLPKEKTVSIFYVSAYGNTEKMAKYIAESLSSKEIKANAYEITSMRIEDIVNIVEMSSGIIIGSPTINQDAVKPVWDVLSSICPITNRGKAAGAFGSYGWSGEGVPMMTERLKSLKFKVLDPGLKFNFVPDEKDFNAADEFIEKYMNLM